jgi:hypothetical protein
MPRLPSTLIDMHATRKRCRSEGGGERTDAALIKRRWKRERLTQG